MLLATTTSTHALTPLPYNCTESGCLNEGTCGTGIDDPNPQCQCPSNYRGQDCSIPIQVCDEETSCENGGVCVLRQGGSGYECDCPKARHEIPLFAGDRCQDQIYTPCTADSSTLGRPDQVFSFCVHGGTCTAFVSLEKRQSHTACDCSSAFVADQDVLAWGDHCEVLHSLAEEEEDVPQFASLRVMAVFLLLGALLAMFAYILWRIRKSFYLEDQQLAVEAAITERGPQAVEEGAHPVRVEELAEGEKDSSTRKGQTIPQPTIT